MLLLGFGLFYHGSIGQGLCVVCFLSHTLTRSRNIPCVNVSSSQNAAASFIQCSFSCRMVTAPTEGESCNLRLIGR